MGRRTGLKAREDVEELLEQVLADAGQHVIAAIEQNQWHLFLVCVILKKKEWVIWVTDRGEWASYWLAWRAVLADEQAIRGRDKLA